MVPVYRALSNHFFFNKANFICTCMFMMHSKNWQVPKRTVRLLMCCKLTSELQLSTFACNVVSLVFKG